MRRIAVSDITMKQAGKTSDFNLSFKEKIELSKLLDKLEVSVIELDGIQNPKVDSLLIKSVAAAVKKSAVAVPVSLEEGGVAMVWNALKEARHPRLQVVVPVSPVQMEYLAHKKPAAMLEAVVNTVRACRECCAEVEFVADDATRSDSAFLYEIVSAAIGAGAGIVTVCDTAGKMLPDEFAAFVQELYANVPAMSEVSLGVGCSDELSMADSCAVAAVRAGASEVKAASYRVNCVSLENVGRIFANRGETFGVSCGVRMTELKRITRQILWLCQTNRGKNSPFDGSVQEDHGELILTAHDDITAVLKVVEKLGYDLSEEDGVKVYEAFKSIAAKKENVTSRELDAIVASAAMQVPPTYVLRTYMINSGNVISGTAHIVLSKNDKKLEGVSLGDGPIDAAFKALEQIIGCHYELDDFQIQAITEGREAMGQTVVKLRSNGKIFSGRGISTDIIGASIQAYINALNKIVYEEDNA